MRVVPEATYKSRALEGRRVSSKSPSEGPRPRLGSCWRNEREKCSPDKGSLICPPGQSMIFYLSSTPPIWLLKTSLGDITSHFTSFKKRLALTEILSLLGIEKPLSRHTSFECRGWMHAISRIFLPTKSLSSALDCLKIRSWWGGFQIIVSMPLYCEWFGSHPQDH